MTREQQADIARKMTGSNLSTEDIIIKVFALMGFKNVVGPEVDAMVQEHNLPFDKAFPIVRTGFNLIAEKHKMDPAVLFWLYMEWKNENQ